MLHDTEPSASFGNWLASPTAPGFGPRRILTHIAQHVYGFLSSVYPDNEPGLAYPASVVTKAGQLVVTYDESGVARDAKVHCDGSVLHVQE